MPGLRSNTLKTVMERGYDHKIAALESETGMVLLERHPRGVSLTAAGQMLVGHAEGILGRLEADLARPAAERVCHGTLLSKRQYRIDLDRGGYVDGRVAPHGRLTSDQVAAIDREP